MSCVRRLRLAASVHGHKQAPAYVGVLIKISYTRTALKDATAWFIVQSSTPKAT